MTNLVGRGGVAAVALTLLGMSWTAWGDQASAVSGDGPVGWRVQRAADGSVILAPQDGQANGAQAHGDGDWQTLVSTLEASGWRVERDAGEAVNLYPGTAPKPAPPSPAAPPEPDGKRLSPAQVEELMAARGWKVARDSNGNLILEPQAKPVPAKDPAKPADPPARQDVPATQAGAAAEPPAPFADPAPETSAAGLDFEQAKQILEKRGWRVERQPGGDLILTPAAKDQPAKPAAWAPPVAQREGEADRLISFDQVQGLLASRGWNLSRDPASNLELVPAKPDASGGAMACAGWRPDATQLAKDKIALPLDSDWNAHVLADIWLRAQGGTDRVVGAVRRINRVYLVSILERGTPSRLATQVSIRQRDGCVMDLL